LIKEFELYGHAPPARVDLGHELRIIDVNHLLGSSVKPPILGSATGRRSTEQRRVPHVTHNPLDEPHARTGESIGNIAVSQHQSKIAELQKRAPKIAWRSRMHAGTRQTVSIVSSGFCR
jgi:hypothetical protein